MAGKWGAAGDWGKWQGKGNGREMGGRWGLGVGVHLTQVTADRQHREHLINVPSLYSPGTGTLIHVARQQPLSLSGRWLRKHP